MPAIGRNDGGAGSYPLGAAGRPQLTISSRWFRAALDEAGTRIDAELDPVYGLGDFYRLALGAALLLRDGFLLHAAALEVPGASTPFPRRGPAPAGPGSGQVGASRGVHLFCGPSGFGKTTLARLAPSRAVLADDTVAVRVPGPRSNVQGPMDPQAPGLQALDVGHRTLDPGPRIPVWAYPTPFFGEYGRPPGGLRTEAREVTRIYLLAPHPGVGSLGARKPRALVDLYAGPSAPSASSKVQGPTSPHPCDPPTLDIGPWTRNGGHRIEPVSPGVAAAALLAQVIAPDAAPESVQRRLLEHVATVAERIPAFRLTYRPDASVWAFLNDAGAPCK